MSPSRPSRSLDSPVTTESGCYRSLIPQEAFIEVFIEVVASIMQIHEDKHEWKHGRRNNLKYLHQPLKLIKSAWVEYLKSMREGDRKRLKGRIEAVNGIQKNLEDMLVFYETTDTELIEPEGFVALKQQIVDDFAESVASVVALTQPEAEQEKPTLLGAAAPLSVDDRRFLEALPPPKGDGTFVNRPIRTFVESILGD